MSGYGLLYDILSGLLVRFLGRRWDDGKVADGACKWKAGIRERSKGKEKAMIYSPTFSGPCCFRSHMTSSPFRELINILLENTICTVVVMISEE